MTRTSHILAAGAEGERAAKGVDTPEEREEFKDIRVKNLEQKENKTIQGGDCLPIKKRTLKGKTSKRGGGGGGGGEGGVGGRGGGGGKKGQKGLKGNSRDTEGGGLILQRDLSGKKPHCRL